MNASIAFDSLRIDYRSLTLRSPYDQDIDSLMSVYDDSFNLAPGPRPVTDPEVAHSRIVDRVRTMRYPRSASDWHVELIVEIAPVGVVGWATLTPFDASTWKNVETSCWVAPTRRGQRHSRTVRQALLALVFDGLGAELAVSRAEPDNFSNATSKRLGYRRTSDAPDRQGYFTWILTRPDWDTTRPDGIEIEGHEAFCEWLHAGT